MKEYSDRTKKLYLSVYDNIAELADYITRRPRKEGRNDKSERGDEDFTGTKSFAEAFDYFKFGDEKLYNDIRHEMSKINVTEKLGNARRKQTYENRVCGCMPNVPAYLLGHPLNMINPERDGISSRVVNIILSVGVPWHIDKKDILKTGLAYLNVIDLLEKKGYRCNLYASVSTECYTDEGRYKDYMLVRIKTDREPLNLKKICFPIANPSMLRRIFFKWAEVNDSPVDITNEGYGHNEDENQIKNVITNCFNEDYIVWTYEGIDRKAKTMDDIIEDLKNQGVSISR